MGEINSLAHTVSMTCPHCGEENEIDDLDVSVTVWGHDCVRRLDDGVHPMNCEHCHKHFVLSAQLHIGVQAVAGGVSPV
jgi:hypothetical protein